MDTSVGTKTIVWGSIGAELIAVVYDLRWMVILSIVLILADMWWGHSEAMKRLYEARKIGNATSTNVCMTCPAYWAASSRRYAWSSSAHRLNVPLPFCPCFSLQREVFFWRKQKGDKQTCPDLVLYTI